MIRRRGTPEEESSEDDEEDVFSSLAKKTPAKEEPKEATPTDQPLDVSSKNATPVTSQPIIPAVTSSMKRHHGAMSNSRKAQMDAVLQELEAEKAAKRDIVNSNRDSYFVPDKKGSFVEPGEEHLTTNLFVGNLAPNLTETAIAHVFAQFGDLHSVKIMWPRTEEERSRGRVSGFVCYHRRLDAEDAMNACNEADPFRVGRRLMVRWGKPVLRTPEMEESQTATNKRSRLSQEVDQYARDVDPEGGRQRDASHLHVERRRSRHLDGSMELNPQDVEEFHILTRQKLCASRQAICEAMSFCFEHSGSYIQIGEFLKDLLLESSGSVETRISRLYLLSDVLFNSQQPGVKNAFRYRDAIEKMAHDVFYSLGRSSSHGDAAAAMSRLKRNKMETAVRAVLAAWTNWGVFDPTFLDELETRFEGRDVLKPEQATKEDEPSAEDIVEEEIEEKKERIILAAQGNWAEVDETLTMEQENTTTDKDKPTSANSQAPTVEKPSNQQDNDIDGEPLEEGDLDEEGLRRLREFHEVTDDENNGDDQDEDDEDAGNPGVEGGERSLQEVEIAQTSVL